MLVPALAEAAADDRRLLLFCSKDSRTTPPLYLVLFYFLIIFRSACCQSSTAIPAPVISSISTNSADDYPSYYPNIIYGSIAGGTKYAPDVLVL
jgi:hypothetical protein